MAYAAIMKARVGTVLAVLAALASIAGAQIVLKPKGENGIPLRMRALKGDVEIRNRIATTKLEYTFQNELAKRTEAELIYALPRDTVVTFFAYWYEGERVIARVAEKERAAAIYKHITDRMHDPALIEMIGKRTFRAKIFPVMPNADLRIEITMVQALPSDAEGDAYVLPITTEKGDNLDHINLAVHVADADDSLQILDNYGLHRETTGNVTTLSLQASSYRPQKDLRVHLKRTNKPLYASVYAAPSGGRDGFFAIGLTSNQRVPAGGLGCTGGVKLYSVHPARVPVLKPGKTVWITGRYHGSGPAKISLGGKAANVDFGAEAEANNPASKLWASSEIESLSRSNANRSKVVAMSKRFTIPSKFTSWLAVPKAEMERYKVEIAQAEMEVVAKQLATLFQQGREDSAEGKRLEAKLDELSKKVGSDRQYVLRNSLYELSYDAARRVVEEETSGRANGVRAQRARRELERLTFGDKQWAKEQLDQAKDSRLDDTAEEYAKLIKKSDEGTARGRELRRRLSVMLKSETDNEKLQDVVQPHLSDRIEQRVRDVVMAERRGEGKTPATRRARTDLLRMERLIEAKSGDLYATYKDQILESELSQAAAKLAREIQQGRTSGDRAEALRGEIGSLRKDISSGWQPNLVWQYAWESADTLLRQWAEEIQSGRAKEERAQELRKRWNELCREFGADPERELQARVDQYFNNTIWGLWWEDQQKIRDREKVNRLTQEVDNIARALGTTRERLVESRFGNMRADARYKLLQELRQDHPDPAHVKQLEAQLIQEDPGDQPEWAKIRVQRIENDVELEKLQYMERTPEQDKRMQELKKLSEQLRVRMGDPLITSDAPGTAKQVVAVMPDGEVKALEWNPMQRHWEARFDIPNSAREGDYVVQVIAMLQDGTRKVTKSTYRVDLTAPKGRARVLKVPLGVRLEVEADEDTVRASAITPWGEVVPLLRGRAPGEFYAVVPLKQEGSGEFRFILTDRAHNRGTALARL